MPPDHPDSITTCPGCGGRNTSSSAECDWCGRPFVSRGGRLRITAWQVISSLFLLALVAAIGTLAWLNAGRALPPMRAAAVSTSTPGPTVVPTPAVTPRVTTAVAPTLTPPPQPAVPPTAEPEPEATPTPEPQSARIVNTNGQGVTVRLEPGPQAARAGALREGTRVLLTGNDQTVAARPWREIETEDQRMKGWVQADFLQNLQSSP